MSDLSGFSLLELFRSEVETQAGILTSGLLALENAPGTPQAIEPLMRAAHSVKGAARIVSCDSAVTIAHAMEDCLVAAQKGEITLPSARIDALLAGVDLLSAVAQLEPAAAADWAAAQAETIAALLRQLADRSAAGPASATAAVPASPAVSSPAEVPVVTPAAAVRAPEPVAATAGAAAPAASAPPLAAQPAAVRPAPGGDLSGCSLLELFRSEVETQAGILTSGLLALENAPGTPQAIEPLMRAAHSVKGAARIVSCDSAVTIAHAMEDCLVAAQKGEITLPSARIDALLAGVDLLSAVAQLEPAAAADWAAAQAETIAALLRQLADRSAAGPATATAAVPASPAVLSPAEVPVVTPAAAVRASEAVAATPVAAAPAPGAPQSAAAASVAGPAPAAAVAAPARPAAAAARPAAEGGARDLRISAERLSRLMGQTGEVLIEAKRMPKFGENMLRLKQQLAGLARRLEDLRDRDNDPRAAQLLADCNAARETLAVQLADHDFAARRIDGIAERLHREVLACRMRPFNDGVQGFPRMV
ncbi:MAG TPA: Hpt domain-containing protein, partial [bacterium]|nr:Hpt domain-containing protein [bacterium]